MENNIPSLLSIDIDFIVENVGKISKNFSRPLDLPSSLIELIFKKYLSYNRHISEQEVKYFLSQKANFTSIDFSSSLYASDSWINLLPPSIVSLDISCTALTDEGLLKIVATLSNLQLLKANECINISEKCWTCVSSLTRLQVFEASSTLFGDEALSLLVKSACDIRVLNLGDTRVFKAISEIKDLTQLLDLDLLNTKITPGAVADIWKALTHLKRFRTDVLNNAAFNHVYSFLPQSLENLELHGMPDVHSFAFDHLTGLQRLQLKCWNSGNVFSISNLTNLTYLMVEADLSGTEGYDWSKMKYIKAWDCDSKIYLTSLMDCPKISLNSLADRRENLTKMTNLVSIKFESTDNIVDTLKTLTSLKKVQLPHVNENELVDFQEMLPALQKMEIEEFRCSFAFPEVTKLTSLQKLRLYEQESDLGNEILTKLTCLEVNGNLEQVAKLTNLQYLDIRYATDKRVELLTSLTNLTYLDIGGIAFSEENFEALTNHLTNLKTLLLMDTNDIDSKIPHLTRLKKLHKLFIDNAPTAGKLALLNELPLLKELVITFAEGGSFNDVILELLPSPSLLHIHYDVANDAIIQQFAEVGINFFI